MKLKKETPIIFQSVVFRKESNDKKKFSKDQYNGYIKKLIKLLKENYIYKKKNQLKVKIHCSL